MPIYLDYSATTPVDPRVFDAMTPYFKEKFANPSSIHTMGREIRDDVEKAREEVAKCINASPDEIIFTPSGTASDNLAIMGMAKTLSRKGKHIITSSIEHKAVLQACKEMEKQGFEVTYLPVTADGMVEFDTFKDAVRDDTSLVTIMTANNEVGTIQPIKKISEYCINHGIYIHTDAVQALGKIPIDVNDLGVHMLTFSGHKICAPKGVGVLYIDENIKDELEPVIVGGSQEYGLSAGTENVANIIAVAEACRIIGENFDEESARVKALRDMFEEKLTADTDDIYVNGHKHCRIGSLSNLAFKYIEGEALMIYAQEVCCSTGSACTSESVDASHVLYAMGVDPVDAHSSLRFSFGRFSTEEEVLKAVDILKTSYDKLRQMSPLA